MLRSRKDPARLPKIQSELSFDFIDSKQEHSESQNQVKANPKRNRLVVILIEE